MIDIKKKKRSIFFSSLRCVFVVIAGRGTVCVQWLTTMASIVNNDVRNSKYLHYKGYYITHCIGLLRSYIIFLIFCSACRYFLFGRPSSSMLYIAFCFHIAFALYIAHTITYIAFCVCDQWDQWIQFFHDGLFMYKLQQLVLLSFTFYLFFFSSPILVFHAIWMAVEKKSCNCVQFNCILWTIK